MGRASVIAVLLLSPAALARADGEPISPVWRQLEPLPGGHTIMALTHAGGRFVGVAEGGGVAFTADGVLWSAHDAGPHCGACALAWNGQELAAVGEHNVGTSHDGLEWEVDHIPDSKAQLYDVVWAGDHWAAVGSWSGGPPGGALTAVRYPGQRWHFRWHTEPRGLRTLAWNGEILVAVGGSSSWSSVDGVTWVYETSVLDVAPSGLRDIVWTGEHFVAVGEGAVALSEDGREWSGITLPDLSFRQVVWTGTELIGRTVQGVLTSRDGLSWCPSPVDLSELAIDAMAHGNGVTLLVGPDAILASHDLRHWERLNQTTLPPSAIVIDAISTRGVLFALVRIGHDYDFLRSSDGVRWSLVQAPGSGTWRALAHSDDVVLMVGVHQCAAWSDGQWQRYTHLDLPSNDVTWVGDRFVAVGDEGAIAWSVDGETWTSADPPPVAHDLHAVVGGGGLVVAVGDDGSGVTTADWSTWHPWSADTTWPLTDIAWGGGRFVAVAYGSVLTSNDGVTWQVQDVAGIHSMTDVTWTSRGFVAVDHYRAITSPDGLSWTLVDGAVRLRPGAAVVPWHDGAVAFGGTSVCGLEWTSPAGIADGDHAWVVPAAAHADGLGGTHWRSDLVLGEPAESPVQLDLVSLERWRDNSAERPLTRTLLPGTTARLDDLVHDSFGASDAAGAVLIGASAPLVVHSRSYTTSDGGTCGQRVPAVPVGEELGPGELAVLPGIGSGPERRTNLGAVSLSGEETVVHFELHNGDGSLLGTVDLELPPFASGQLSDAFAGLGEVAEGYAVAWSAGQEARFVAYASVVDEATGDPAFVAPSLALTGAAVVPAVASLPGAEGTYWRSDLVLLNLGVATATIRLEFAERDRDSSGSLPTATLEVGPAQQVVVPDLVVSLFGLTAAGALHLEVEEGELFAASRTWTAAGDGAFGQDVPPVPVAQALVNGGRGVMVGLAESCDLAVGFRTNLGLVNLGLDPLTITIEASHGDRTPVGSRAVAVPPRGAIQLGRVLAGFGQCEVSNGVIVVSSADPDARFVSYASVVDNATGDPVFITVTPMVVP